MSHDYSIYFTTKDGKFMGQWAIQDHYTRNRIEDLKEYLPHFFLSEYEGYSGYTILEVNLDLKIDYMTTDFQVDIDIYTGIKHAIQNNLRMFLG